MKMFSNVCLLLQLTSIMVMMVVVHLLLLGVLTHAQHELCRREKDMMKYYIYEVQEQIDAYGCSINCKNVQGWIELTKISEIPDRILKEWRCQIKWCKSLGHIKIQEDKVILPRNKTCAYSSGHCFDDNVFSHIFWESTNVCDTLYLVYKGAFTVWTLAQNKTKFIKNDQFSIKLTKQIRLCAKEVWMTDYKNFIALAEEFTTVVSKIRTSFVNSTFPEECTAKPNNRHLHKNPKKVTGFFCIKNSTFSCERTGSEGVGNNSTLSNLCNAYFCNSTSCKEQGQSFNVCKKSLKVNAKNNTIQELPGCPYSVGHCLNPKAFWTANGIVKQVVKKLPAVPKNKTPTTEELDVNRFANEKELFEIQVFLYSAIFFVSLFLLGYVFGVIVNCFSLRRFNEGKTRKASLLNIFCPSLMSRLLFLPQSDVEVLNSPLAVTVNNDLYCL